MKPIAVVGLFFGDEGKGTIVDYLVRKIGAKRVGRYCGGAQALHHVHLPDGTIHGFSQFGAGTFAGAKTELNKDVIVNPHAMNVEALTLSQKGISSPLELIKIDPRCLVTVAHHVYLGRLIELYRGDKRHGTTGMGVGETLQLHRDGLSITVGDLKNPDKDILLSKLNEMSLFLRESAEAGNFEPPSISNEVVLSELLEWAQNVDISLIDWDDNPPEILEGSQGTLIDPRYGFSPYVTKTNVSADAARASCKNPISVLGVIRAYGTRHGRGPFPSERDLSWLREGEDNQTNDWQESFRVGHLDPLLLDYALEVGGRVDNLAITCMDRVRFPTLAVGSYWDTKQTSLKDFTEAGQYFLMDSVGGNIIKIYPYYPNRDSLTKYLSRVEEGAMQILLNEDSIIDTVQTLPSAKLPVRIISRGPTHEDKMLFAPIEEWV